MIFAHVFLAGASVPVLAVVWLGLTNEGFSSFSYLFYPGLETWLQVTLLVAFIILLPISIPSIRFATVRAFRASPTRIVVIGLGGLIAVAVVLGVIGIGESPWRKFYTFVVAPRAVTVWLLCAVFMFISIRITKNLDHAA